MTNNIYRMKMYMLNIDFIQFENEHALCKYVLVYVLKYVLNIQQLVYIL